MLFKKKKKIILIAVKLFTLLIQVQIYLAVLAIANSFRKLCLTAKENHVAWHKHETKINNKTECRIIPYKRVPFRKYSYLESIKIFSFAFKVAHFRKLSAKNLKWKFIQIMCNHDSLSNSSRLSRKRLLALQFQSHRSSPWLTILLVLIVVVS